MEIIIGTITHCKMLAGSFRNVIVDGHSQPLTVGIGQDLRWPQVGDKIKVTGLWRNGRFLTEKWEYVTRQPAKGQGWVGCGS